MNIEETLPESNDFRKKLFERLQGISSKFGLNYPLNPKLKYEYPQINPVICQNIVNSLIKYPRFYVQTLHLMNKMNLPCPLMPFVRDADLNSGFNMIISKAAALESSSECESEIETEIYRKTNEEIYDAQKISDFKSNKKFKSILKANKLASSSEFQPGLNKDVNALDLEEAFEKVPIVEKNKLIQVKVKPCQIEYDRVVVRSTDSDSFAKIIPNNQTKDSEMVETTQENEERNKDSDNNFIRSSDLEKNRLKLAEMRDMPVFKNYERGEKNSRLYLKNLSKKVTEQELKFIFGRYIDWGSEVESNAFDIRLMKEGRMKGQAFLTFPNEDIASRALNDTNGYLLDNKPIVVQFARSAKPPSK